ncbi:MAG: phage holin [Serratia inhibens]|uniref:phage holin n=1 Tax=Serratia inhibens TaxID=2338073 RepID=UPI003C79F37B
MRTMPEKIADNATHGGWSIGLLLGAINYFSPSEWMVIGIIVGILCSVVGCVVGIWFRCRREKLLKMYLIDRSSKNISAQDVDLIGGE